MKYNTRSVKNTTEEVFIGRYGGVDLKFEPGEMRYLPNHIAEHIANQLHGRLFAKAKKEGVDYPYLGQILGEEIRTKKETRKLHLSELIKQHEKEFKEMQDKKAKEDLLLKQEALKIAKKDDGTTSTEAETGDGPTDKTGGSKTSTTD